MLAKSSSTIQLLRTTNRTYNSRLLANIDKPIIELVDLVEATRLAAFYTNDNK